MTSPILISRRKFLAASGALTAALSATTALPASSAVPEAPEEAEPLERQSIDNGQRAPRAGPVAALPDGSLLWATTEPEAPYTAKAMWPISRLVLRRSRDGGGSWGRPRAIVRGTKDYSLLSHALKSTLSGSLLHVFVRYSGYDYETHTVEKSLCEAFVHRSADGGRTWSEPRKLPTGKRYIGDVLSLEQLRDGRLIYPFAFLTEAREQFACSTMVSDDDGSTWTRSPSVLLAGGGGFESGASEPSVVEIAPGKLWMLIRAQTGFLWQSFSHDRGMTWSAAAPSAFPSSNAPAVALRLRNGEIALAWNNDVRSNYSRQCLVLGITRDGRSFRGLRELDFTDFPDNDAEPPHHTTYPYLTETRDGRILVSYNKGTWMRHNRPTLAKVDPRWVAAGRETVDFRDGRVGWHTVNPGPRHSAAVERYAAPAGLDGLWLELEQDKGHPGPAGIGRGFPLVTRGRIELDLQVVRPEVFLLFGDSLLDPRQTAVGCLRLRWTRGQVLLGAGEQKRTENGNGRTEYSLLAHVIGAETPYPSPPEAGAAVTVSVLFDAAERTAAIRLNGGPEVRLRTGPVLGLSQLALAIAGGGLLRVRSIKTGS